MFSAEDYADAAIATLKGQLPAALQAQADRYAAQDAALGREIPLDPPHPEAYYAGGTQVGLTYPYVEVAVPDANAANFDLNMVEGDLTLTLIVRAWAQHANFDVLYRMINRYGMALFLVLAAPHAVSDAVLQRCRFAWRFNPETQEQDNIESGVVLGLEYDSVTNR